VKYNLTETQKELARWIVEGVRKGRIAENFFVSVQGNIKINSSAGPGMIEGPPGDAMMLVALDRSGLLVINQVGATDYKCGLTGSINSAVDTNFREDEDITPVSTLAHPHPTEIALSIDRLRTKYPDPKKLGFLVMRFTKAKPFDNIVQTIRQTAEAHGLAVIRADEHEFHSDLWGNVRTFLHGCGFGIAVYERIDTDEHNANVGLEVGYLMAMNKPVLLLKDKNLKSIQSDLAGKLYKQFDPHDAQGTIPDMLTKWLNDNGIVVSPAAKP
jgi:hypothetical protein